MEIGFSQDISASAGTNTVPRSKTRKNGKLINIFKHKIVFASL